MSSAFRCPNKRAILGGGDIQVKTGPSTRARPTPDHKTTYGADGLGHPAKRLYTGAGHEQVLAYMEALVGCLAGAV